MLASTVTVTFPTLTDELEWFANLDAFNNFMASGEFTLTDVDLPSASLILQGAVKAYGITPYVPVVVTPAYFTMQSEDPVGQPIVVMLPLKADFDALQAKVDAMGTKLAAIIAAQIAAGQLITI